jgi:hypothetical protein
MLSKWLRELARWLDGVDDPTALYLEDVDEMVTRLRRVERLRVDNPQRESF